MQNLYKKHKTSIDSAAKAAAKERTKASKIDQVRQLLYREYDIVGLGLSYHDPAGMKDHALLDAICKRMVEEEDAKML